MKLNNQQKKLFNQVIKFIKTKDNSDNEFLIQGEAGSGKTFTTGYILDKLLGKKYFDKCNLFIIAPTNAAKKVIKKTLIALLKPNIKNYNKFLQLMFEESIQFKTIHSFFKSKKTYDIYGDECFEVSFEKSVLTELIKKQKKMAKENPTFKVKTKNLVIIDEVSMLDPIKYELFQSLLKQQDEQEVKILYLGDKNQLSYINDNKVKLKNEEDYFSPVFSKTDNVFILKGNERSNNDKITKIINKSKKCVINKKYSFKLTKKDLNNNIKLINDENLNDEKIQEFIKNNRPKLITYSNKRRDELNNIIRAQIYKDNVQKDRYLFLEGEELIFENTLVLDTKTYNNTDEVKVKEIKFDIVERIQFFIFNRMFQIQSMIFEDDTTKLYQISKSQQKTFDNIINILKNTVKDFFQPNPKFVKKTKTCECCNESKIGFREYNKKELICKDCYNKFIQYIKDNFYCKGCGKVKNHTKCSFKGVSKSYEKKYIFNEMFKLIDEIKYKYNIPAKYAYSITVYKSQGSSYENVIIDYDNLLSCTYHTTDNLTRAMYVGISRARENLWFLNYSYRFVKK